MSKFSSNKHLPRDQNLTSIHATPNILGNNVFKLTTIRGWFNSKATSGPNSVRKRKVQIRKRYTKKKQQKARINQEAEAQR